MVTTNDSDTERKSADEAHMKGLSVDSGLDNLSIQTSFRLGQDQDRPRPLKVILLEQFQLRFLLDNTKNINTEVKHRLRRVVVSKDLNTITQREERKERFRNGKKSPPAITQNQPKKHKTFQKVVNN